MEKVDAVVLVSGGLDSTVLLHYVIKKLKKKPFMLNFYYGQKHNVEREFARHQALSLKVPFAQVDVSSIFESFRSALLLSSELAVPNAEEVTGQTNPITVVPFRNQILLSVACGFAESKGIPDLFYGPQHQDFYAYWDCTTDFVDAFQNLISLNRSIPILLNAPLVKNRKVDNIKLGKELGIDFRYCWTCYDPKPAEDSFLLPKVFVKPCEVCPSCVAEGEKVLLADYSWKPVEQVKTGDVLLSFDETTFKLEPSKVLRQFCTGIKDVVKAKARNNTVSLTKDHKIAISTKGNNRLEWREVKDLKRKDATYYAYVWPAAYTISNTKDYALGYLRGVAEGDGSISRGVNIFQKDKSFLEEFKILYCQYVMKTRGLIKEYQGKFGLMYKFQGGYGKRFLSTTKYNKESKDYLLGYIAGWILSDGCVCYNISNKALNTVISQRANSSYLDFIKEALSLLNIKFNEYTALSKGINSFIAEGVNMTQLSFRKCWRIPLVYGTNKKNSILEKLFTYYNNTNFEKSAFSIDFNCFQKSKVYDLTTTSGSFICEGFLVHNCVERIDGFKELGLTDPQIAMAKKLQEAL